eukprot:TRINITY_DN1020_c5_g1_i1.p1 TRINITY_DN1020_c5_g1~~TRINITY_DN1020_c5_g1_i1.p1  ORF type:complete len:265 (-),score=12.45 TRINITY_DN1020_c5_g1_i1:118-912(-)
MAYYSCQKCRRRLFTNDDVVPHIPGATSKGFHHKAHHHRPAALTTPATSAATSPACVEDVTDPAVADASTAENAPAASGRPICAHLCLSEAAFWVAFPAIAGSGKNAGKIVCPGERCGMHIGSFKWSGEVCSCGNWITPAFLITRTRVDVAGVPVAVHMATPTASAPRDCVAFYGRSEVARPAANDSAPSGTPPAEGTSGVTSQSVQSGVMGTVGTSHVAPDAPVPAGGPSEVTAEASASRAVESANLDHATNPSGDIPTSPSA